MLSLFPGVVSKDVLSNRAPVVNDALLSIGGLVGNRKGFTGKGKGGRVCNRKWKCYKHILIFNQYMLIKIKNVWRCYISCKSSLQPIKQKGEGTWEYLVANGW